MILDPILCKTTNERTLEATAYASTFEKSLMCDFLYHLDTTAWIFLIFEAWSVFGV